ncbi:GNAT family N-acetyltransferase [Chitinophaga sp. G-6-1-13]|uniref:GNAT family N-acetyltransferase n=1 Tax=Chitinophaga fulva TaxID=2728842 RepID=A0A848GRD6_9BACT|nr:GNAT family N-acetyltransferase [Chitinophaga fulva]NML41126.1 GNAT family N-acetyltransferase [Chitinophaga fulva]
MNVDLIVAELKDVDLLHHVCTTAYTQHFTNQWESAAALEQYLVGSFSTDRLTKDILEPGTAYYLIYADGQPAGFVKLNDQLKEAGQASLFPHALELERIYMLAAAKGTGVGKIAMEKIEGIAREKQKPTIVLYVVDVNETAIRFYERNGFVKTGKTRLELPGFKEEVKPTTIMCKTLSGL